MQFYEAVDLIASASGTVIRRHGAVYLRVVCCVARIAVVSCGYWETRYLCRPQLFYLVSRVSEAGFIVYCTFASFKIVPVLF